MMIVAAGQRSAGHIALQQLIDSGRLARDGRVRPLLDPHHTLPGEGVGVVILKRLAQAQADGDTIHSVIRSLAAASGVGQRQGTTRAILAAIQSTGETTAERISLVESALDGGGPGEAEVVEGLATGLAVRDVAVPPVQLRTVADAVGSLGGATSLVALLRAAESLKQAQAAPLVEAPPHPQLPEGRPLELLPTAAPLASNDSQRCGDALTVAAVDQTLTYAAVVSKAEQAAEVGDVVRQPESRPASPPPLLGPTGPQSPSIPQRPRYRTVFIAADSISELLSQLESVSRDPAARLGQPDGRFTPSDRFRLALVVRDADELAAKVQPAWRGLQVERQLSHLAVQGIFIGQCAGQAEVGRIAFCLPGQGSQYAGMFQDWLAGDAGAAATVQRFDAVLEQLGLPSFRQVTVDEAELLGRDIFRTQLAVLLGDALVLDLMQRWRVRPQAVVGHSFGEFAALLASGAWDLATAIRATKARCDAIAAVSLPEAAMTSLLASPAVAQQWVDRVGGQLWVANRNAPQQTVVGGRIEALDRLEQQLRLAQVKFKRLRVPCAFHTPLLAAAQPEFARRLQGIQIGRPQRPLLSTVTADFVDDPALLRRGLVDQLTAPVRYQESITRLLEQGVRCLVEVGPSQALSGLNRRIAAEYPEVVALPSDHPGQDWAKPLACVRALLAVNGALDEATGPQPGRPTVRSAARQCWDQRSATLAPVLEVSGTPRQMGRQYGEANRRGIVDILAIAAGSFGLHRKSLPDLSGAVVDHPAYWNDQDWDELCGVAEGAGVTVENLAALNYWLYPDIDGGCAHFVVPAAAAPDRYWHGANEDLPLGTILGGPFAHPVVIRRPVQGITHTHVAMIGQVGSITGMNQAGLSLSSSMLLDRPLSSSSSRGRLHGLLVADILRHAGSIDEALEVLQWSRRRGAWGMLLADVSSDQRCYVEYDGTLVRWQRSEGPGALATNHSQLLPPVHAPLAHSLHRFQRLQSIFAAAPPRCSLALTQRTLRDRFCERQNRVAAHPTMDTLRRVDNQASLILAPRQAKLWIAVSSPVVFQRAEGSVADQADAEQRPDDRFVEIDLGQHGWHRPQAANQSVQAQPVLQATAASSTTPAVVSANSSGTTCPAPGPSKSKPSTPGQSNLQHVSQRQASWLTPQQYAPLVHQVDGNPPSHGKPVTACCRFVNRMVHWPAEDLDHGPIPALQGDVLVAGAGLLAESLVRRLQAFGVAAVQVKPSEDGSLAAARLPIGNKLPRHLILAPVGAGESVQLDADSYRRDRRLVDWMYRLCQHWYRGIADSGGFEGASCVAAFSSAGDFGCSGQIGSVINGAVAGLVKAIRLETMRLAGGGLHAQAIDVHPAVPLDRAAELVIRNLARRRLEMEVGYDAQQRRGLLCCIHQPLAAVEQELPEDQRCEAGTWIVTGGARGVTAAVVAALARRYRGPFHLIGSSPLPKIDPQWTALDEQGMKGLRARVMRQAAADKQSPADAWARTEKSIEIAQNLQRFREQGVECHYWSCDVSDRTALSELLIRIRQSSPPIIGVIHGAGFEKATRFASKKWPLVQRTIDAKVDGCAGLMALTGEDPLRYFISFGSISGRFGGVGQTDYCLANEMQAKLASWYAARRPQVRVANIAWHAWDEVGMAARPETRNSPLLAKLVFMSVDEGVRHLLSELACQQADAEVTITHWDHYKRFHPDVDPLPLATEVTADQSAEPAAGATSELATPRTSPAATAASNDAAAEPPTFAGTRCVNQLLRHPLADSPRRRLTGRAVVLGDHPDARAIVQMLQRDGVVATVFDASQPETALEQFQQLLARGVPEHLILATARDQDAWQDASRSQWQQRQQQQVTLPAQLVQRWLTAAAQQAAALESLSALVCLGGDFAVEAEPLVPPSAVLASMLRAFSLGSGDRPQGPATVKVFDAPIDLAPATLAGAWLDELRGDDPQVEVAVTPAGRHVVLPVEESLPTVASPVDLAAQTWIGLVGLAGNGLALASEFAERTGCKLQLLVDDPGGEAARRLPAPATSQVQLHSCDLGQRRSLQALLDRMRRGDGDIHGMLDLLGVEGPAAGGGPVDQILRRLTMLRDLLALTRQDPLGRWIVCGEEDDPGFAGVSKLLRAHQPGRAGMRMLSMTAPWSAAPRGHRPDGRRWVDRLVAELAAGLPRAEVQFSVAVADLATSASGEGSGQVSGEGSDQAGDQPAEGIRHRHEVDADDVFLREHRFRDTPLLPLVVSLEWMGRAAVEAAPQLQCHPLQWQGIRVRNRLSVPAGTPQRLEVVAQPAGQGEVEVSLRSDLVTRGGRCISGGRQHVQGTLVAARAAIDPLPEPPPFRAQAVWHHQPYPESEAIYHGSVFRALRSVSFHSDSVWGKVLAPDPAEILGRRAAEAIWTPMVTLDAALFLAGLSIWRIDRRSVSLPVGIDSLTIWRVPRRNEALVAWAGPARPHGPEMLVDLSVWDAAARPLLVAQGFRCAVLRAPHQ